MQTINEPSISSQRLGIKAYEKSRMHYPTRKPAHRAVDAMSEQSKVSLGKPLPKRVTKEMKISFLKSLQSQSNSGLVKIRDVAEALDYFLKKS